MANSRTVSVTVNAPHLADILAQVQQLNANLDRAARPRRINATGGAGGAGGAGTPGNPGLNRGASGAGGRGDTRDFARQAQGMGGIVQLYATFAANVYAVGAAFNALSKAADFSNMEKAATILSTKVGVSINNLAKDMKGLTDGAISMADALASASLASSAGLTTTQIKELTTVAKGASIALGRDMTDALQRVFRGTIKIEPELLDELGLMVKVNDANKAYAKTLDKTVSVLTDYERRQAFVNAVTTQGISKYKELADQAANPFSKLLSSIKDLSTEVLGTINTVLGPFINLLSQSPNTLLLGMIALVSLLIKGLIPAVGQLRAAWAAEAEANQRGLTRHLEIIEERKQAIRDLSRAQTDAAKAAMVTQRTVLEASLPKDIKNSAAGKQLIQSIKSLTWATTAAAGEAARDAALNSIPRVLQDLRDKVAKTDLKIAKTLQQGVGTTGAYATQATFSKAILTNDERRLQVANNMQSTVAAITTTSQVNLGHLQRIADLERHSASVQNAIRTSAAYREAVLARNRLTGAYDTASNLGMVQGFKELRTNIEGAAASTTSLGRGMQYIQGTMGILTIGVGKLVGAFSVWMMLFVVILPLLGKLTDSIGLTSNHAAELAKSMDSLNSKLDLSKKISEDLKVAGDFHTIFDLNASSAMSFAESLDAVAEAMKKYNDFKTNSGPLTKFFDDATNLLTLGYGGSGGKIAMDPIMEEFDRRMATDKKFASANKDTFTTNIEGASTTATAAFRRANAIGFGDTEDVVRKVFSALNDPKLKKEAKEYADTASGMSKNLKELNDISSDYIISITNQSKELKALNAFSSSSAQAIKLLDKTDLTKSGANIQEFLSGITDQFEEMSGISLPADLELLRTRLNRLQEDVNNNYKTAMELAGSDKDLQKKAEDDRAKSLSQGTSSLLGSYGGIEKVQQDYIGYSLKASKSLADLATAAGRASLAQTSLSAKLKETQFYGSFSKEGEARAIREARKTEEKIANIQIKAEKTNAAAIDAQKSNTEQQLRTALSLASKELFKNSKSNNPSPLGTGSVKDQAIQALSVKELDGSIASQILSLVNSLESLGAASVIATLKIDSIRASLGKARESEARAEFKETDAEADKKFKPEEDKLFEELNNLEKKSQSIALLDSSYLSARVDSEINLIKAKADILQYEKDLAIKIGEYNTLVEQLIKDPTNVSIGEAVVGKARARDEAFKKGEPLRDLPKVIQDEENLRIRKTNLEITEKLSDNLSEQVDLASSYSDYLLSVSTNYSKIAEFNTVSTQTLLEQYSIQERILEAQIAIEKSKVGDREAEQKIVDLQQQHLAFKLDTHQKLTDLFKKETELSLKIREQSGRASDIFGTEGLQEAITIAMDRIEETTGKSKSVMSQLATGIVDSADIIVDSFTTMIQKMDETKLTFKAFSDMVRNTLSDMFRDMASDAFKNAMKSGIKLLAANFGYDTRTNQEKAASALQITANSSLDQLKLIQQDMRALLQALVPGKIDPIAQQGIDLDKQYNLDWEKANKANDTGVRTSPYPYPTSASIMSRQLDGVSSIGATSASAGTYDPLVQAVSSTASSAKETNRLLNEIAQKINPSSIPVPDVIQPPAMQDSSTPILSKTATTNIEKGGTKIDVAADKFNMATTVMHGAVGALVGALATGGSAKGALGGILMGVATSVISGGITGGLTSIFAKAKGGIVGPLGDMPLHKYARGGIATSPQMALFGEGSKNEAYVPLPDNRSIPVTLKGGSGGATFGDTNITVTVTNSGSVDTSISADQATNLSKALSVSIKATIQEELMKQMKPRGMLHG